MKETLRWLCSREGLHQLKNRWELYKIKKLVVSDGELYDSCITLKNLALVQREKPLSADAILEILMDTAGQLKPVYGQMLALYRSGRDREAFEFFASAVNTKAGRSFGAILVKLDRINPAELATQMEVFQNMMSQKRMTYAVKKVKRQSWLTTLWATATIFALMINFVVVVVLLDTLAMLQSIF